MIDLYTWPTPNGRKVSIMLEECRLRYRVHPVDLADGRQRSPEFLSISPNARIPAIVDRGWLRPPVVMFESGAILIYLAEKTGKLLPRNRRRRARVLQWAMWQIGNVGPTFGQLLHFVRAAPEPVPYAVGRFRAESARLIGVLDDQLDENEYVAGDYSIADILLYPWIESARGYDPETIGEAVHVRRWLKKVGARRAVKRGMAVPDLSRHGALSPVSMRATLVDSS